MEDLIRYSRCTFFLDWLFINLAENQLKPLVVGISFFLMEQIYSVCLKEF